MRKLMDLEVDSKAVANRSGQLKGDLLVRSNKDTDSNGGKRNQMHDANKTM